MKDHQPSLRTRLIHLVLVAVLPALGLILYGAGDQRFKDSRAVEREALRLAQTVAISQQRLIDSTRHLLVALSALSEVRSLDGKACSELFDKLIKEYPLYANLGAATIHGDQFCSAKPLITKNNIADRSYFQDAVERRNFAIGEYQVGRATGKASLNVGYPIIASSGAVEGVVFAALDLVWLKQFVDIAKLPSHASLAVYDRNGRVLARYPDDEQLVGKSIAEADIVRLVLRRREGVAEATGLDGRKRLYGFTSIGDGRQQSEIFLHIGIPIEVALADANRLLGRNLAALLIVSLLAALAAWYGGDVFVLRKLRALVDTSERLGAGDLSARTGLAHGNDEIGRLAGSFDKMAASLQARRAEAAAAGARLESNLERIKALQDIDMALTSTLNLPDMLNLLMEKIELVLPGAVTTIRLINQETGTLDAVASRNLDSDEWRSGDASSMGSFAELVLENKILLTVANVQKDPRNARRAFAERLGLISYLGVPLIAKDRVLGLIAFYTKVEHAFSDDEIEFLTTLAGQSAIAIHNAKLYEESQRSAAELSALHALTIAATHSLDLDVILRAAVEKITAIFHFDATRIFLFDAQWNELHVAAAFEAEPDFWKNLTSFRSGEWITGKVAESREPIVFEDITQDSRYAEMSNTRILETAGARFLAVLPIATKLRNWGVVVFVGKQARKLQPHELRLLTSMANQIGIAVENGKLYAQTAAKAKELGALYSVAGIAGESLDINVVLEKTMEKILEVFEFDAARIYLCNTESGDLELTVHRGLPEGIPLVQAYEAGRGRIGRALESGEGMYVDDMLIDSAYNKLARHKNMLKAGYRSSMLIPLKIRGEGLGVMNFLGKKTHHFSEAEKQLINAIAYHLGIAVGNARLYSQVKQKTIELENASRGKDEFLGVISHELRTPLNVIKGYTEIMLQGVFGEVSDEQRKALETISNQSLELFNMISGVLQVTRIEANAVRSAAWEVNLGELLDELRSNYIVPAGKRVALIWDYPANLPAIWTDDEKLKAVIQNLVNNAIKFTENGTVAVTVKRAADADLIEFKVSDTGIGIPPEKIKTIFEMFQQVDSSATRKFGGVGLGLYIVKKFTELLGGRVSAESEIGRGSTFIVHLPINAAEQSATKGERQAHSADAVTPPTLPS